MKRFENKKSATQQNIITFLEYLIDGKYEDFERMITKENYLEHKRLNKMELLKYKNILKIKNY